MKKLIMMMALAVGLTGFAAQNDKLISFYTNGPDTYADGTAVVDGECYALVWVKTGAFFGGFNADGSAADSNNNAVLQISPCAKGGKCDGVLFHVAADQDAAYANTGAYQVYLMDTRDAAGVPSAVADGKVARVNGCGLCPDAKAVVAGAAMRRVTANLTAAGVVAGAKFTADNVAYADNTAVLDGERVVLAGYPESNGKFHGIDWNLTPVVAGENVQVIGTVSDGKIDVEIPDGLDPNLLYEVVLLDSRGADGNLVRECVAGGSKWISGWCSFVPQADGGKFVQAGWNQILIGESGVYDVVANSPYFEQDPSPFVAPKYAAVYDLLKLGAWTIFPLPVAYTNISEAAVTLKCDENYQHLNKDVPPQEDTFDLDVVYSFDAYPNDKVREIVLEALADIDFTKMGNPGSPAYAKTIAFHQDVLAGNVFPGDVEKSAILKDWYVRVVPYFQWNADFEVSFDRTIKTGSVVLAGCYEQAKDWEGDTGYDFSKWVGDSPRADIASGTRYRLLASNDTASVTLNYQEVCKRVQEFSCGVHNFSPENWGTTMRVDLKLYENTGRCNEKAGGVQATVGTYKYTFKGPLNVKFYNADGTPCADVENISTNHDGRVEFPMPVMSSGKDDEAFVGWTNANGVVVAATPVLVHEVSEKNPIKSWYTVEEPLELYASFKPAKKTTVTVKKTETSSEKSDIKVTEEWLEKNNITETDPEKIAEKLEEPQGEAQRPAWQNYLLGMDPDAELKVDKTNGKEDDKALVVSTVQVVAPDAGIKVGYSLDKVDENETGVKKEGAEQATKDLKIDLAPEGETPTGYYKMNVIFTPTTTTGGETTEGEKIKVPADNTIGVLRVESEDKIIPVAVPWTSLDQAGDVTVAEIVKTSSLSKDDMMHVYDQENKRYDNWTLNANGEWEAVQSYKLDDKGKVDYSKELDPPESKTVPRGAGVWLERQDTEKPFYLIGEYKNDNEAKSVVNPPAPESPRPEYNLIAPTGIEDTNLNEVKDLVEVQEEDVKDDKLMVLNKGIPNYYTFKNGKWGYSKQVFVTLPNGAVVTKTIRCEDDAVVPAGTGLWYISGKSGETKTIDWSQKVEAK